MSTMLSYCIHGGVLLMPQGIQSEAQIQFSEVQAQAGYHRRGVCELADWGWMVLYLLPAGDIWGVTARPTLA